MKNEARKTYLQKKFTVNRKRSFAGEQQQYFQTTTHTVD
jgi:hypothetical protein